MLRLGSLCTGYGGLDLAAEHVLGPLHHTWHAEIDPHASTVLAHHWPTTPNLGDLTTVDWTAVEPVDVLTAGYPCCFRASDVGAPHRRERVFIAAWPAADTPSLGHGDAGPARVGGLPAAAVRGGAQADGRVALLPTPRTSDTNGAGTHGTGGPDLRTVVSLLPTPMASDGGTDRGSSAGFGLRDTSRKIPDWWGAYAPAVTRWEQATGRTAPSPTEPGGKGQPRLAPAFVEWLMGLPAGWVTDHLERSRALRCLGNGVVWQQAAHAYTELLGAAA